jgi:hypothetical protein
MENEDNKVQEAQEVEQEPQAEEAVKNPQAAPNPDEKRERMAEGLRNKWRASTDFYSQRHAANRKASDAALQSLAGTRMMSGAQVRQRVMGVPTSTGYAQPQQQPGSIFDMAQGAR